MFKSISRSTAITLSLLATLSLPAFGAERPPADYTDPVTGMEFMAIPGGTFVMGSDEDKNAQPKHEVSIKPFLLGRFEVTFEQYSQFCASTGRLIPFDQGWGGGNRPVINIIWQDAVDFTKWLSEKTDKTYRLPSEAEWEFAARGGTTTRYPWGDEIGKNKANCNGCGSEWDNRMTAPVGSFESNRYGLYDMIGNIYEWCLDTKHKSYEGAPSDGSAWVVGGMVDSVGRESRINRGGSWFQPTREMTIARRCWDRANEGRHELGFRVLLEE